MRAVLAVALLTAISAAAEWETDLATARKRSVEEGRLLFIEFTTDT